MRRTMGMGEFHGVRRDTVTHAGLTLTETEYVPGHRLPNHAHEYPFFSLLVRGTFLEEFERGRRECVPTSLVFYPELEPHQEAFGPDGGRAFHVELGDPWLTRMREHGMTYAPGSSETLTGRLNLLMTRLHAWFMTRDVEISAEEIALEMFADITHTRGVGVERAAPPWLERIRDVLHQRCCGVVSVTEFADEAGVHPVHAARVFRKHGFSDQAHLTRRFKELVGVPPREYRRLVLRVIDVTRRDSGHTS